MHSSNIKPYTYRYFSPAGVETIINSKVIEHVLWSH